MKTMPAFYMLLFVVCLPVSSIVKAQAVAVNDSLALVNLYDSCDGPNWINNTNWLTSNPVSTWYGVTVTGTGVTQLSLYNNRLTGKIPAAMGNLTALTKLHLYGNRLSDSIPSSIGNLVNLEELELHYNNLTGKIPAAIGNLTNLSTLELGNNQLTGSIPPAIGNLIKLTSLHLYSNLLRGNIPHSFSRLVNLQIITLDHNRLSGSLPSFLGNLTSLRYIILNHNQFIGQIPYSFRKLDNLYDLDVSSNHLTQTENFDFISSKKYDAVVSIDYNNYTFTGIEQVAKHIVSFLYGPQAPLTIHQSNNILSVSAGGTLSNNTYYWYKVGQLAPTAIVGDSTFQPAKSGRYYAFISNSVADHYSLTTDTINYRAPSLEENKTMHAISMYPNPVKGILTITGLDAKSTYTIAIADISGRVWINAAIRNQPTANYNVSKLKPGSYVLNISDGMHGSAVSFIKE